MFVSFVYILLGVIVSKNHNVNALLSPQRLMTQQRAVGMQHADFNKKLLKLSSSEDSSTETIIGVVAPLTFVRGCPMVSLEFGDDAVLDFVLSTGSNVNTIHPEIVESLKFPTEAPFTEVPVVASGMGKYFDGESIELGNAKLIPTQTSNAKPMVLDEMFAVNLPLEPAGHGQLGIPFFYKFAAVEFAWHGIQESDEPTLGFYLRDIPLDDDISLTRIPIFRLPAQIALLSCDINGGIHQAILATCSPVTILSPQAAAGIELSEDVFEVNALDGSRVVKLQRSVEPVPLNISGFDMGSSYVYVGDLPGHDEFLREADMVLGTDFLLHTNRMVLTEEAAYFEAMKW